MKSRILITSLLAAAAASVSAQEFDDMYFRSKDRDKEAKPVRTISEREMQKMAAKNQPSQSAFSNPTDSYSARVVNPEYTSRMVTQSVAGESDYFIDNYSVPVEQSRSSLSYAPGYFGPGMYGSNGPYYNSGASPFMSPYHDSWGYNPYGYTGTYPGSPYSYGYSPYGSMYGAPYSPFAYGNGSGWNTSMGFTMSPYSWSPYFSLGFNYAIGSTYGTPWGWNNGWGGYSSYCPGTAYTVVSDANGRHVTYGKRTARTNDQAVNYALSNGRQDDYGSRSGRTRELVGGRNENSSREYYDPQHRRAEYSGNETRSYTSQSRSSLWNGTSDNSSRSFFNSDSRSSMSSGNVRTGSSSSSTSSGRSRGRD
jgi:hypothetical protein